MRTASTPTAGRATTRARRVTSIEHGASKSILRKAAAGRPGCAPGTERRAQEPNQHIYHHLIGGSMSCTSCRPVAPSSRWLIAVAACALAAASALSAPPKPDPGDGGIKLPAGFHALVFADALGPLRHVAVAPNGDVYVKTTKAGVIGLRDTNGDGRADLKEAFGGGGGTGIAVHDGYLYHSSNSAVFRYKLTPGQLKPTGAQETIVTDLPAEEQHDSKAFSFDDDGRLYVEVGSPANALGDPDRALHAKGKDPTEFLTTHGGLWR